MKVSKTINKQKKSTTELKIFVGGIPPDATEVEIQGYFSIFGKIKKVDLPLNKRSKKIKGFAFVIFASQTSFEKAIQHGHHLIRGKVVAVTKALGQEEASRQTRERQGQKLFLKGLPPMMTTFELRKLFEKFGEVEIALIPPTQRMEGNRAFGYVVMKHKQDYLNILNTMEVLNYGCYSILISAAVSQEDVKREKHLSPNYSSFSSSNSKHPPLPHPPSSNYRLNLPSPNILLPESRYLDPSPSCCALLPFRQELQQASNLRLRNNNGHLLVSSSSFTSDFISFTSSSELAVERERSFGPANHFDVVEPTLESVVNRFGVSRFGPDFSRRHPLAEGITMLGNHPISDAQMNATQEFEDETVVEVKQIVTTKYSLEHEGLVYDGRFREVNVWGMHPHRDNFEDSVSDG